jgi:hypothetical protein
VFTLRREPLTNDERARLRERGRRLLRSNLFPESELATLQTDIALCDVTKAWIPAEASEELPIYVLETTDHVLCVAGQWLCDPHTVVCSDDLHARWDMDRQFFRSIELRADLGHGIVFQTRPLDAEFVPVQALPPAKWKQLRECELASSPGDGVLAALRGAQLIE